MNATTSLKILVVEDEIIISKDIQRSLKKLGYQVVGSAITGTQALHKVQESRPDLVLMDVHIQGEMDGIETAALMRERFHLPVIYLTAFADTATLERARQTSPFGYVLKPFEERDLNTAIEMAFYKHASERRLQKSEEHLRRVLETGADAIILLDHVGNITFANAAAEHVFGATREELMGRSVHDEVWQLRGLDGGEFATADSPFERARSADTAVCNIEYTLAHASGRRIVVSTNASPLRDEQGAFEGAVCFMSDITERRALQERLQYQALHDPLTGLPNRALFLNRLEHALTRIERTPSPLAVMFIDIDNFKNINESLGHAPGDQLLIAVAQRLQKTLRMGDTAARMGGDEFTILIDHIDNPNYAINIVQRVLETLQAPFEVGGRQVFTSPSIGVAFNTEIGEHSNELLRQADAAMYEAKRKGRARYEVYREGIARRTLERLELESDLRHALERNEFVLHYQPKVHLNNEGVSGFEALLRWQHPTRGFVSPGEFISIAEETGIIVPIGLWVLREACRQAREWQQRYPHRPPLSISVNLSARQIQEVVERKSTSAEFTSADGRAPFGINVPTTGRELQTPNLVEDVAQVLQETGLAPESLILEITETVAMGESSTTIQVLQALKNLGVRLAIDDFGTGYSSMAYLKSFPIDFLKIDRQFVAGMLESAGDTAIVASMITLAHALNLTVVAEGTETLEEIGQLRHLGCDMAQGFFFARPMPTAAVEEYLKRE